MVASAVKVGHSFLGVEDIEDLRHDARQLDHLGEDDLILLGLLIRLLVREILAIRTNALVEVAGNERWDCPVRILDV